MCSIISLFFPEAAGKTLRELNLLFQQNTKVYKLTEKGSKLSNNSEEEVQVFLSLRLIEG